MARVKIGHAADTAAGLIISDWYNKPWSFVLRAKEQKVRGKMADACREIIGRGCVHYSQAKRNTLFQELKKVGFDVKSLKAECYCDCSSLMAVCAYLAGVPLHLDGTNAPTTNTMRRRFTETGAFEVLTGDEYTHQDARLLPGDVLDVPKSHTVMALTAGGLVKERYEVGEVYVLKVNLKVRRSPDVTPNNWLTYDELTKDGKKHSMSLTRAIFPAGTRVTCKEIRTVGNRVWMRVPSGWLCAVENGKVYIF